MNSNYPPDMTADDPRSPWYEEPESTEDRLTREERRREERIDDEMMEE